MPAAPGFSGFSGKQQRSPLPMPGRWITYSGVMALLRPGLAMDLSFLLADGSPTENLSILDPVSPPGQSIRYLFILVLAITGGIFVAVEGVLLYNLFRFPRTPRPGSTEPPQLYGSKAIEIAWTAAPALIVFILILVIVRTDLEVQVNQPLPESGDNALFVTVIGHQWWWEYVYDYFNGEKLGMITANELHIPVGATDNPSPIYLTLKSADVCHSFWVPRLAGKMDLIPGRTNTLWFQTNRQGLYLGQCAEYCGTQHATMLLRVQAEAPEAFQSWLRNQQQDARQGPAMAEGREFFMSQSCVNCHRIRGTSARGTYAPDLTHLKSRQTLAAGILPNDPTNLLRWIVNPQSIKSGCLMPAFGLKSQQFKMLADYLSSLE
jgi:cytochrome c oxidase subunit II